MFNQGHLCPNCGPVKESKKRSIAKVSHECCKECGAIVKAWESPLKERSGHCNNCGNASFKLRIFKHQLLRKCKQCEMIFNIDTKENLGKGGILFGDMETG